LSTLLTVFDTLIDALSKTNNDDLKTITVRSKMTAFSVQNIHKRQSFTSEIRSFTSQSDVNIIFQSQNASGKFKLKSSVKYTYII
jgi:aspartokinase